MRRVSLLLIVCLLVQAVAVPQTMGGPGQQSPAKPLPLPNQQAGMILSGLLDALQETTDAMQPEAAASDTLAGWVYVLELEQQRLAVATEAIAAELTAFGRYLAQAGFPATVRARHAQAARQVQARLAELNRQLDTLIREPTPANFRPLADTLAAGRPAPVVPDLEALPFGPVRAALPVIMAVPPLAPERPLPVSTGAPEWADQALDLAPEAATPEAMAALEAAVAQAGTRPADLAAWVAGRVTPDWYPARQQDPAQVLASGRANDADAAALLVTLLRLAGVPARYGTGFVSLKPANWAALLGLENGEAAKQFLAAAGIPLQVQIGPQREVLELTLPHVWVEYWDSGRWHAAEPLWRQQPPAEVRWIPDLDLRQYILYVRDRSPLDATLPRRGGQEATSQPRDPPQPLLLPARAAHAAAALPAGWAGNVRVELPGLQAQIPLSQASTGALQLAFEPATADDDAVLQRWWGSWVPSYLVTYRPVLRLGTQELGRGDPVPGGSPVPLQVAVQAGTWQEQVRHTLTAGAAYGLLVTGTATPAAAARSQVQSALGAAGLTAGGPTGATLAALAWQYQAQVEDSARRLAATTGIPAVQGPRITVSAFAFETYWLLGIPYLSELRGVGLHAARVAVSPVHPDGDEFAERIYTILMAAEAAYQEGQTTRELYGVPGQSTVSLLQAAADRNATIHWVCRANGDDALPPLDADAGTRTHVREAFDQGLFVVAPSWRTGPVGIS